MKLVVTGVDADGRSCVREATAVDWPPVPQAGFVSLPVYDAEGVTPPMPATVPPRSTPVAVRHHDPGLGTGPAWRAVRYRPGGATDLHRTGTIDYDVVLEGTVTLELEAEAVALEAGDLVVMAGVAHRWRAGPDGCVLAALLVPEAAQGA